MGVAWRFGLNWEIGSAQELVHMFEVKLVLFMGGVDLRLVGWLHLGALQIRMGFGCIRSIIMEFLSFC